MNRYFNWNRFIKLLKFDFVLNRKKYLLFSLLMFIALFLWSYFSLDDNYGNRIQKDLNLPYTYTVSLKHYQDSLVGPYFIFSIIVCGSAFSYLRNKTETLSYLMLPASTLEKVFVEVLIRIVIFSMLCILFFWLDFKLATYIFRMSYHNEVPVIIPDFGILEPFKFNQYWKTNEKIGFILSLLSLCAFMLAGASSFKKYALFKTVLAFGGLLVFAYLITLISYHLFLPNKVNIFNIQVIDREWSNGYATSLIVFSVIGVFSSLFLFPFAYFKLKEKEV